jgi:hypothetical protein
MKSDKSKKRKDRIDEEIVISHVAPVKKKKRPVEDDAPKKKKRDPELAKKKLKNRKAKLNEALEQLDLKKLTKYTRPGEREYLDEYVWMFNRIGRLIRNTEKRALKSGLPRDVYALSTLISQQREIIADIRTLADLSGQMVLIKDVVLQPMVSDLGQNIVDSYYQLRRLVIETSDSKQTQFALGKLEEIVKEQSKYLQVKYGEGVAAIERVMTGQETVPDPSKPKKKAKKKK